MALTNKRVAKLSVRGRYHDEGGLYLRIASPTSAHWLLRFQRNGRERWLGLGSARDVDLQLARRRAREARQKIWEGVDPIQARKTDRNARALEAARAITFEKAVEAYFNQHEGKWRNAKHRAQFLSTLKTYAFPKFGTLPVAAIDVSLVLSVIEPLWLTKTATANRVRQRIENVLDWAFARGYRTGSNPARWKGHLANVLPPRSKVQKTVHHPALPFTDLPEFMIELAKRDGSAARALEFTILTAARTGEVIGATWSEIALGQRAWTIPAERMKTGKEHRVPLSDRAVELLGALPREADNPFVFLGVLLDGLASAAMGTVLSRMGRHDIVVHGFRSTFRDWSAERTNYPNHVVEMALAHVLTNKVEAAYRRGDLFEKRKRLMTDWAKFCCGRPSSLNDTIVSIRKAG